MHLIKRVSTEPASPMVVAIDRPDGQDGGFHQGGVYYFQPAGQEGDQHQLPEFAARIIMSDPGMAGHFSCDPALPGATDQAADDSQPDSTSGRGRGGRKQTQG